MHMPLPNIFSQTFISFQTWIQKFIAFSNFAKDPHEPFSYIILSNNIIHDANYNTPQ